MITLREKDTGTELGSITDEDLRFLREALEEESESDTDYWIDAATVDMLEDDGASDPLLAMLRSALEGRDGLDVTWSRA